MPFEFFFYSLTRVSLPSNLEITVNTINLPPFSNFIINNNVEYLVTWHPPRGARQHTHTPSSQAVQLETLLLFRSLEKLFIIGVSRLVWLSGLSTSLCTERLLVGFPVTAHTWVAGQAPSWRRERQPITIFLPHHVSLPLFLLPFPSL